MSAIQEFESRFAEYVGAKHAIAMSNGTVTLEVALRALGVKPGDRVATTGLTMAATSIAILNVGAVPVYCDVDPETWLMDDDGDEGAAAWLPVSLYGLHHPGFGLGALLIDDAAQTLRPHSGCAFTSYSMQGSKHLALGEGGMIVTNDDALADAARSIGSLGYDLSSSNPRISKEKIKDPRAIRHVRYPSLNARMNEATAELGLAKLHASYVPNMSPLDVLVDHRRERAQLYADAVDGCEWITPQKTPEGWSHDMWSFAVAIERSMPMTFIDKAVCGDTDEGRWRLLAAMIEKHGGTRPFAAWRLTYQEPVFRNAWWLQAPANDWDAEGNVRGLCPVAESLQPRIMAFTTNSLPDAERNATALRRAIQELNG